MTKSKGKRKPTCTPVSIQVEELMSDGVSRTASQMSTELRLPKRLIKSAIQSRVMSGLFVPVGKTIEVLRVLRRNAKRSIFVETKIEVVKFAQNDGDAALHSNACTSEIARTALASRTPLERAWMGVAA